jgi:hypothetical protein
MAYRIEGKDIVISGFEQGIADTPYSGIADMRNIDIISVPGEASVNFDQTTVSKPAVFSATAYTAQNAGDTITTASTTGLYVGTAIVLASNTAGGLSNSIVYYVLNIVGNTFQVSLNPGGSAVVISSDGAGTFTTYQYGNQRGILAQAPVSYYVDRSGAGSGVGTTYIIDGSNYAWAIFATSIGTVPANSLIFLGNIGGAGASSTPGSGTVVWNQYLFLFGGTGTLDIMNIGTFISSGPVSAWTYNWKTGLGVTATRSRIATLLSQEDGNMYWTSAVGLGSLIETPGDTFDPTDANSYAITSTAVALPPNDEATCIAELGANLLIGGRLAFVYVWDKLSLGFNSLLNVPDLFTTNIIATSQNAYVFSGVRGRIYITNGSGIDLYKKFPDYLTGTVSPYIRWIDASFDKDEIYFSATATDNANTVLTTIAGSWAIDLETDALRMLNKLTSSGYSGTPSMVVPAPRASAGSTATNVPGTGVLVGWFSGSTYNVDMGLSTPYANYESYLQTDMIPVGTFLDPFTPSQVEWKTSVPIVSGEGIRVSYRTNLNDSFTTIGTTTTVGALSDMYQTNFQKAQWIQLQAELDSTTTTPSRVRLTELRIRDWPSGKNSRG